MKQYKVVQVSSAETMETSLNELARAGWKVVTANAAFSPEKAEMVYFALLENFPLEEEMKEMLAENTDELDSLSIGPSAN